MSYTNLVSQWLQAAAKDVSPLRGLYIISTPIGNSHDITLRALHTLSAVDMICAEDTRVTAKLLSMYGIKTKVISYNDHSDESARHKLLTYLHEGKALGLVSDAGTPLVNDPGYKLVRDVVAQGINVTAVPGAASFVNALVLSGLSPDKFVFMGFLPPKSGQRRAALSERANEPATLIFFETGQRLCASLADMYDVLGDRSIAIAREMTKIHEQVLRCSIREAMAMSLETRGEFVIVVEGQKISRRLDDEEIKALLEKLLVSKPLKHAAKILAESYGLSRQYVYEIGLQLRESNDDVS